MKANLIVKKIPNISHVPQSEDVLKRILKFLENSKEETIFYDFLRNSNIINTRQSMNKKADYKDSTERKWKNHLKNLHIVIEEKKDNKNSIKLSALSSDYVNQRIDLTKYIHSTIQASPKFNSILLDLIELSYLVDKFDSLTSLYSYLRDEFGYVNRSVSATRNLTGMINYMSVGKMLRKEKNKIEFIDTCFFTDNKYKFVEAESIRFVSSNLNYGGYANMNDLKEHLQTQFAVYTKKQIVFILRRIIRDSKEFLYQAASSSKERGIIHDKKNILFIRLK